MSDVPRVLLLCSHSQNKANGITIANLFKGWPKEQIAVVEFNEPIEDIYVAGVSKYYLLGNREMRFIFPFNLLRTLRPSKAYRLDDVPVKKPRPSNGVSSSLQKKLREAVLKSQRWFLHKTGLMMVSRKLWISPELDQWIRDFKPDVIYATTGDICKLNFIAAVTERYGAKLAIHIYDDFVNSRHQYTAFPVYWRKRLDRAFRRVVDLASLHLSISEKMAREYTLRYGRRFFAYHNPIDPSIWISSTPKVSTSIAENVRVSADISMEAPFTFVYAGKVNQDTQEPLLLFISACDRLRQAGHPVQIKIYSPYPPAEVQMRLGGEACSGVFMGRVSYTNLPDIFRQADALLLPLDFSDETVRYIRLSMLTKATEYMIAGTPIFLFAPGAIAVSEYLLEHDAAFHADSPERLESDILSFIRDEPGRRRIARNGFKLGIERHMQEQVGRQLRDQLSQLCCD